MSVFVLDTKTKKDNKIVLQRVGFKISRDDNGSYSNQEKRLKDDKAPEKPIETTMESSFMSFLASGASFSGHEAAKQVMKSQEVLCHIKSGRRTVLKVYCSKREACFKKKL